MTMFNSYFLITRGLLSIYIILTEDMDLSNHQFSESGKLMIDPLIGYTEGRFRFPAATSTEKTARMP